MNENEFILQDRLGVIRDTINKYGEENFYISFSGGKDSTVVHHLVAEDTKPRPLPKKKNEVDIYGFDLVKNRYATGWNRCLDEILGETE